LVGQVHWPWLGAFWQPSFQLTFNLGAGRVRTSTLRRRINQMDWAGAALELRKWVHGGGRVLPGLVARRQAEIALLEK
jgi:lysozyme